MFVNLESFSHYSYSVLTYIYTTCAVFFSISLHLIPPFLRYIFKGDEELPFLPLHRQSAYLIGRDRKVADIPTDHPSCSKQHAVLQYRLVTYKRGDGTKGEHSKTGRVKEWA